MALARAPLVMAMPPLAAVKLYVGASAMRSASAAMRVYAVELPRLLLAPRAWQSQPTSAVAAVVQGKTGPTSYSTLASLFHSLNVS